LAQCRRQKALSPGKAKSDGRKSESASSKSRSPRRLMDRSTTQSARGEDHQPSASSSSLASPSAASVPHPMSLAHTAPLSHHSLPNMSHPPPTLATDTYSSFRSSIPSFFSSTTDHSSSHGGALPFPMWSSHPAPSSEQWRRTLQWSSHGASHSSSASLSSSTTSSSSRGSVSHTVVLTVLSQYKTLLCDYCRRR